MRRADRALRVPITVSIDPSARSPSRVTVRTSSWLDNTHVGHDSPLDAKFRFPAIRLRKSVARHGDLTKFIANTDCNSPGRMYRKSACVVLTLISPMRYFGGL